jgi:hypothetical protein
MMIMDYLQNLFSYSIDHGVNPYFFITIYIVSFPFYYLPLFKFKKYVKEIKSKSTDTASLATLKGDLIKYIIINRLAWAAPYIYVLIWGRGLPLLFVSLIYVYIFLGACIFIYRHRGVINDNRAC